LKIGFVGAPDKGKHSTNSEAGKIENRMGNTLTIMGKYNLVQ